MTGNSALPGVLLVVIGGLVIYWAASKLGLIVPRSSDTTREVIHNPDGSRVVGGSF